MKYVFRSGMNQHNTFKSQTCKLESEADIHTIVSTNHSTMTFLGFQADQEEHASMWKASTYSPVSLAFLRGPPLAVEMEHVWYQGLSQADHALISPTPTTIHLVQAPWTPPRSLVHMSLRHSLTLALVAVHAIFVCKRGTFNLARTWETANEGLMIFTWNGGLNLVHRAALLSYAPTPRDDRFVSPPRSGSGPLPRSWCPLVSLVLVLARTHLPRCILCVRALPGFHFRSWTPSHSLRQRSSISEPIPALHPSAVSMQLT